MVAGAHPFDPISPNEIRLAVRILEAAFPEVPLRYKRIDLNEPIKKDVLPYIEAERLRQPLPVPPARLLYALFHRLDTGAFYKAILNADKQSIVYAKELPREVQVCYPIRFLNAPQRLPYSFAFSRDQSTWMRLQK